jgi:hypothetical protein
MVQREPQVHKVQQVMTVPTETTVQMVQPEPRVTKVIPERLVPQVRLVPKEYREYKV